MEMKQHTDYFIITPAVPRTRLPHLFQAVVSITNGKCETGLLGKLTTSDIADVEYAREYLKGNLPSFIHVEAKDSAAFSVDDNQSTYLGRARTTRDSITVAGETWGVVR